MQKQDEASSLERALTLTLLICSVATWLTAFLLPSYLYVFDSDADPVLGLQVFMVGAFIPGSVGPPLTAYVLADAVPSSAIWNPLPIQVAQFAWYANPLWLWNVLKVLRRKRPSLFVAAFSAILALSALQRFHTDFGDDHGVAYGVVPLIGAYVWATAITGWAMVCVILQYRAKPRLVQPVG